MQLKFKKSDRNLLLLFFTFAIPISFYGYDYSEGFTQPILDTTIYLFFTLTLFYVIVFFLFPKFFPSNKIMTLFVMIFLTMVTWGFLEINFYKIINGSFWNWGRNSFFDILLGSLGSSLENVGILLGLFLGKKYFDAQIDIEKKEKEKRESELRILKSQIDPHFLFNNLNTVDSLIDTDPQKAKKYLRTLSQLYRYLIRTKDNEVVLLEDEIEFAKKYVFLIQERFGDTYSFEFKIKTNISNAMIPPGALQTLLENVTKHNKAIVGKSLETTVEINDKNISVSNAINLKDSNSDSNGTGLQNLAARYSLLSDQEIKIDQGDSFKVTIPLLKTVD